MVSKEWIQNQIRKLLEEYANQSDERRYIFIDGKLTILKLWLAEKDAKGEDDANSTKGEEK